MPASDEAALVEALANRAGLLGERWISFDEPAEMAGHLQHAGCGSVVHFGPEEVAHRITSEVAAMKCVSQGISE